MASVNIAIIVGRLGKDPEVRYTSNGEPIANMTIATSETWKDKTTGEKKEQTDWHRVVAYGKLAEIIGRYLKKGALVHIQGSSHTRKWQDKDGQDRYTTEIKAKDMKMLGGKSDSSDGDAASHQMKQQADTGSFADMADDIPF